MTSAATALYGQRHVPGLLARVEASIGFWAGWSYLSSSEPPMIILGEASSHTVDSAWSPIQPELRPLRTAYQQGSCCQW